MAVNSISPPSIRFYQVQTSFTQVVTNPQLPAFITGPCKEIVKAFDANGNLNSSAKFGNYTQLPIEIPCEQFPSPRGNIKEVTVESSTIKTYLNFSGTVRELPINPGTAFLASQNTATRAVIRSNSAANFTIVGKTIVLAFNNTVNANTLNDVVVTFTGIDPLTPAQIVSQINTKVGKTVSFATTLSGDLNPRVELISDVYGAASSITIRGGGSANTTLGFNAGEERVEGSGFRGQEDNFGNDTQSPWIEYWRGAYFLNGAQTSFPAGVKYGQLDESNIFTNGLTSAVAFDNSGLDIRVGDYFFADGTQVKSAEVMKVENTRFKLGTINPQLSTYDIDGKRLTTVYDQVQVPLLTDPAPLAPRYAYFIARNLQLNSLAAAATLLGTKQGQPAEEAFIESTSAPTGPFNLAGLNLKVTVTKNGVEQPEEVFVFTGGPFADMAAVVAAISIPNIVPSNDSGKLKLSTVLTGQGQAIKLAANSTANSVLNFSTASDTTDVGKDVEFINTTAILKSDVNTFPMTLANGDTLIVNISSDGGVTYPTTRTHTSAGATYNTAALLAAALQADAGFVGTLLTVTSSGNEIYIQSTATGPLVGLKIDAASTAIGGAKLQFVANQEDLGESAIQGKVFKWKLNNRTKIYTTTFTSNSLIDAISQINEATGYPIASVGGTNSRQLKLTSDLLGAASLMEVIDETSTKDANFAFGFSSPFKAAGSGRPNPDVYFRSPCGINVNADILRHPVTGIPFDPASAELYIQYRGLRLDVSPKASNPGMLEISDETTLDEVLGPINEENPLALGIFFALQNAPNTIIKALGVDEISTTYPEGTPDAYERVIEFITSQEVYSIAPLTQVDEIHDKFITHVADMADPERGNTQRERVLWLNKKVPTRKVDTLIASGLSASTPVATVNQLNIDVNPTTALLNAGINTALPIPYSAQLYIKTTVNGVVKNYSVAQVNGVNLVLRTSFGPGENLDNFFTSGTLNTVVSNASYKLAIRGAELVIPGSSLPDKQKIAETVNAIGQTIKNRRVHLVFPEKVVAPIDGISKEITGYYVCAAYAGLRSYQPAQQPFSNFLIKGFTDVIKSARYFSEPQLNIIAGGGVFIVINDKVGFPLYARHQLTTDVSSVETQESSIVAAIDAITILQRQRYKKFLGNRNITTDLLGELGTVIDATRKFIIEDAGTVEDIKIANLIRDPKRKDGLILEEWVTPYYPLNSLKVYIYF